MTWLRAQLRQGIIGQSRGGIALCLVLVVLTYIVSEGYEWLNHGPNVLFLKNPLDDIIGLIRDKYASDNPVIVIPQPGATA